MKMAEEWIQEYSQSGPFDLVANRNEAIELIKAIQRDAVKDYCLDKIRQESVIHETGE